MSRHVSLAEPRTLLAAEPDLSQAHKNAIEFALRWAWNQLLAANDHLLTDGQEEQLTDALEFHLGRREHGQRLAPGLSDFEHPVRGAKQATADGRIGKEPDFTFRPPVRMYPKVTQTKHWGWFVECKLIEDGHNSRTTGNYCADGVRRFAEGEYAAWMPSGMMLAYVRGEQKPMGALARVIPTLATTDREDVFLSTHARSALHPVGCVDITLTHLWLRAG
jgi:hypothetical protein